MDFSGLSENDRAQMLNLIEQKQVSILYDLNYIE